jgi:organic radical activating enzyme
MVMDDNRLATLKANRAADMLEVFSSVQGEGPRLGERHLFVRFSHCDLNCAYCDTPKCHKPQATFRVEGWPGSREWTVAENPLSIDELAAMVLARLRQVPHKAVSFTGGEPLLHPWAIDAVAPVVRGLGVKTLLETDGMLHAAYEEIVDHIDVLSLDWKLQSATGEAANPEAHLEFLSASKRIETYVKLVFSAASTEDEINSAVELIHQARPETHRYFTWTM